MQWQTKEGCRDVIHLDKGAAVMRELAYRHLGGIAALGIALLVLATAAVAGG